MAQFDDDQRKHLEFVQAVIARMSSSAGAVKGWATALAVATYGAANVATAAPVALMGMVAVALLGLLDARYLTLERRFRSLYEKLREGKGEPYDMSVQNSDGRFAEALRSWSVLGFYGAVLALGAVAFLTALLR